PHGVDPGASLVRWRGLPSPVASAVEPQLREAPVRLREGQRVRLPHNRRRRRLGPERSLRLRRRRPHLLHRAEQPRYRHPRRRPRPVTDQNPSKQKLVRAYLDATNRGDHRLLRKLVLPEFELAMGTEVVRDIADVLELRGPDHLETSLLLEQIEAKGDTGLATIQQRLAWKATGEPAD